MEAYTQNSGRFLETSYCAQRTLWHPLKQSGQTPTVNKVSGHITKVVILPKS